MSHRAGVCEPSPWRTDQVARNDYYVPVPEAVRGVAATRIAFQGAPMEPEESDPGRLVYQGQEVVSSSSAQTPWFEPWMGQGQDRGAGQPRVPPSSVWTFRTTGTDAFDVATFTVDLRYLAVAD